MHVGVHSLTSLECHTGEATVHVPAQSSSEARADSREPSVHGSSATTLDASRALLAAGQNALPSCRPDLLAQVIGYEAVRPKRGNECLSATSQAILASAATLRGGPATASFAGVQCSWEGKCVLCH